MLPSANTGRVLPAPRQQRHNHDVWRADTPWLDVHAGVPALVAPPSHGGSHAAHLASQAKYHRLAVERLVQLREGLAARLEATGAAPIPFYTLLYS